MNRPVIVAVDFSVHSQDAANYAADLALAVDSDLHVFHAVQLPVSPAETPVGYVYEQVLEGTVEEGITRYLKEQGVEWLMVFPRRHGLLEFHRSRSKPIVLHCPVPVLSICEPAFKKERFDTIKQ
jgi:universal stress protein family protein